MTLSKDAVANRVTVSTVTLGQDVNPAFLKKVAQRAQGNSHFPNDPSGLEQILVRDVKEDAGSTAVGKGVHPEVVNRAEILGGVGIENAPPLRGYVCFLTRPTRDLILRVLVQLNQCHSAHQPRRLAACALAIRPGPCGGVYFR